MIISKLSDQIAHANVEGFGNSHEGIQRNVYAAAFDFSQVFITKVGFFCQLLLGHAALLAEFADVLTDSLVRLKAGHSSYGTSFERPTP